jgi:hypothetical protein
MHHDGRRLGIALRKVRYRQLPEPMDILRALTSRVAG